MKSKILSLILIVLFATLYSNAQIKIDSNNKIGIGTTSPNYDIHMYGKLKLTLPNSSDFIISTLTVGGWGLRPSADNIGILGYGNDLYKVYASYFFGDLITGSDKNLKKNISPLYDASPILNKLRPVSFDYINDYSDMKDSGLKNKLETNDKNRLGFIAQEVQQILPQTVTTEEVSDSTLGIRMIDFIPLLVKGFQEQTVRIDSLVMVINYLRSSQNTLKTAQITGVEGNFDTETILFQNAPNPFNEQTNIRFVIPTTVLNAKLQIYNMNGTLLKNIQLNQRGESNVTINANEFVAGMYLYSLITDGRIVDTKQMLLTE